MPTAAYREWQQAPAGFLEQIIEARAYVAAYHRYHANPKAQGALVQLVKLIDFEQAQAEIDDAQ